MTLFKTNYLELVENWNDPNPEPVIVNYDGIDVIRDDLLGYGSKIRFADFLIRNLQQKEIVYAAPATRICSNISSTFSKEI